MDVPEIEATLVLSHSQYPPIKPVYFSTVTIEAPTEVHNHWIKFSQCFLGSRKMLMEYEGMTWRTAFISVSFPTLDKSLAFQLEIWLKILSTEIWKQLDLFFPVTTGRPRYFSKEPFALTLATRVILCFTFECVFLLKNSDVFSLLSNWPEASSYWAKIKIKLLLSMELVLQNNRLWFVKNSWLLLIGPFPMEHSRCCLHFLLDEGGKKGLQHRK